MNSGELRIPYPVHNNSGLRDQEIYVLFFAISCNIKPLNFTNHKFPVTQTGTGYGTGYGIRSSPEFTVLVFVWVIAVAPLTQTFSYASELYGELLSKKKV